MEPWTSTREQPSSSCSGTSAGKRLLSGWTRSFLDTPPTGTSDGAWDHAGTHEDEDAEGEILVRAAAGRLVLFSLPTSRPWLTPMEMLWRQFRREVTHNELFQTVKSLLKAAREFFDRSIALIRRPVASSR